MFQFEPRSFLPCSCRQSHDASPERVLAAAVDLLHWFFNNPKLSTTLLVFASAFSSLHSTSSVIFRSRSTDFFLTSPSQHRATMSRQVPNGREGVVDRKMTFCERLQQYDQQRLVKTCKCCSKFFVHCCACDMGEWDKVTGLGFDGAVSSPLRTSQQSLTRRSKHKQSGRQQSLIVRSQTRHAIIIGWSSSRVSP